MDFVEGLVGLQAEAAADDLLLDLGGAAEVLPSQRCNRTPSATGVDAGGADGSLAGQLKWVADSLSAVAGGWRHGTGLMRVARTACPGSPWLLPRRRG